jgi:hypothetical protein
MTGAISYLLFVAIGVVAVTAIVLVDRWLWRRSQRRTIDPGWAAFSSGRWSK